jgi:flagellar M-ring protein FliF
MATCSPTATQPAKRPKAERHTEHGNAGLARAPEIQDLLDQPWAPKSVVQASVTMDWTEREKTEQSFNPNPDAVRSATLVTETYTTTNATLDGIPGAATNLPPADEGVIPEDQSVYYLRNEETTNYEMTQTETREVEAPGQVKRVSLSVLVDGASDQAQLATLRSVIAAAAGIDESRGDLLAVETLAFDRSYFEAQAADLEEDQMMDLYFQVGSAVAAALLLLALLWYIQRILKNLRLASARPGRPS